MRGDVISSPRALPSGVRRPLRANRPKIIVLSLLLLLFSSILYLITNVYIVSELLFYGLLFSLSFFGVLPGIPHSCSTTVSFRSLPSKHLIKFVSTPIEMSEVDLCTPP